MKYGVLIAMWLLFYSSHSMMAGAKIKKKFRGIMGKSYKWYRFVYSLFSGLLFLYILLYSATIPAIPILMPSQLLVYLGFVMAGFGTIIAVKAFKGLSIARFLGIIPHDDLSFVEPLHTGGLYRWMRHPMYAGLILIFLGFFLYLPYISSLIHLAALLIYLPFGIYFEEKKLIALYGDEYRAYQARVPALFPIKKP
jgi:methanethiol S-methyltransferase